MSTQVVDREVGRSAYRVDEAPAALGISEWCVRKHIRDGDLRAIPRATNEAR